MSALREELAAGKFSADFAFLGDFWLGAPWTKDKRRDLFLDLFDSVRRSIALERKGQSLDSAELDWLASDRVVGFVVEVLNRTTSKSVGLLQALAILAALIAILMPSMREGDAAAIVALAHVALVLALIATLLLFANVGLTWRRQPKFFTTPELRLRELYGLVLVRSHRLRLVQWLAFLCFLLTLLVTAYQAAAELWPGAVETLTGASS